MIYHFLLDYCRGKTSGSIVEAKLQAVLFSVVF